MAWQRVQTNLARRCCTGPSQAGQAGRSQRSASPLVIVHLPIQHPAAARVAARQRHSSIAWASTSRPLAPKGGDTTPSRSICSIIRAARL
jgi:hypothetical protein